MGVYVLSVQCVYIYRGVYSYYIPKVYIVITYLYNILFAVYTCRSCLQRWQILANGRHDFVCDRNTQKSSSYLFLFNRALSVPRSLTSKSWYIYIICVRGTTYIILCMYACTYYKKKSGLTTASSIHNTPSYALWSETPKIQLWYFLTAGDCYSTKTT